MSSTFSNQFNAMRTDALAAETLLKGVQHSNTICTENKLFDGFDINTVDDGFQYANYTISVSFGVAYI